MVQIENNNTEGAGGLEGWVAVALCPDFSPEASSVWLQESCVTRWSHLRGLDENSDFLVKSRGPAAQQRLQLQANVCLCLWVRVIVMNAACMETVTKTARRRS